MIQILEQDEGKLIMTLATEKLTDKDYHFLLPAVKNKIEKFGKIRWYFEMQDFHGWEPGALWQELTFDFSHASDFERIAMVGDKDWEKWMSTIMKPFTSAEVRFFELAHRDEALKWIKQD